MDVFPVHLFNPTTIKPKLSRRIMTGGESLAGDTDVIAVDGGGRWEITFDGIELLSDDQVGAWNAWDMHLGGGGVNCIVPIALPRQAPLAFVGEPFPQLTGLHPEDDDPYFPNVAGRSVTAAAGVTTASAALRATQITINVTKGRRLRGGEPFTIVHSTMGERLYRVKRVLSTSDQTSVVQIEPPLRQSITSGKTIEFDWPRFVARLAPNLDISPSFSGGGADPVSATFIESFV